MNSRPRRATAEDLPEQVEDRELRADARRLVTRSLAGRGRRASVTDPTIVQRLATIVRASRGGRAAS